MEKDQKQVKLIKKFNIKSNNLTITFKVLRLICLRLIKKTSLMNRIIRVLIGKVITIVNPSI